MGTCKSTLFRVNQSSLSSVDHFVRWAAIWGFQDTKDKSVVKHLIKALNDVGPEVRAAVEIRIEYLFLAIKYLL